MSAAKNKNTTIKELPYPNGRRGAVAAAANGNLVIFPSSLFVAMGMYGCVSYQTVYGVVVAANDKKI